MRSHTVLPSPQVTVPAVGHSSAHAAGDAAVKPEADALASSAAIIAGETCQQRTPTACRLREMQRLGMQADESIYNASIRVCKKGQQCTAVACMLREMQRCSRKACAGYYGHILRFDSGSLTTQNGHRHSRSLPTQHGHLQVRSQDWPMELADSRWSMHWHLQRRTSRMRSCSLLRLLQRAHLG